MKSGERQGFWLEYYEDFVGKNIPWLDYSNERVQAQTLSLALEAAGPIYSRRCLDVGCGNGQLSMCLKALQASEVTGIDIIEGFIQTNREKNSDIHWVCGDLTDKSFCDSLGTFDVIFLLEVLQYLPLRITLRTLWDKLAPNGRMIGIVPNRHCPIIIKTVDRFNENYIPADPDELKGIFLSFPQMGCWSMRGLHFQKDQRLLPYQASLWTTIPEWNAPPNRLLFVLQKKG